ncbi:MAG: hypothetical protein QOH80_330, partial [Actinomycetota bacterium]|nr:hypothetical protein [Actinomycetota bacterium]
MSSTSTAAADAVRSVSTGTSDGGVPAVLGSLSPS